MIDSVMLELQVMEEVSAVVAAQTWKISSASSEIFSVMIFLAVSSVEERRRHEVVREAGACGEAICA